MKLNNFITDLMDNTINKITPSRNLLEGMVGEEMETPASSPSAVPFELSGGNKEEQRLFILRMLANKKINIKEAQGLLDALDGEPEPVCSAHNI
jgi:hypothetical protein